MAVIPILIITPHDSGAVPEGVLREMLGERAHDREARAERLRHLFLEGDPYTDIIFGVRDVPRLGAAVSRFVVDLNRERETGGRNGTIKLTDFSGIPLYPGDFILTPARREARLKRYWDSFHGHIERLLAEHRVRLLITGHAMLPLGPSIGPDHAEKRPALALMTGGGLQGKLPHGHASLPRKLVGPLLQALQRHFAETLRAAPGIPPVAAVDTPWVTDEIAHRYSHPARSRPVPGVGLEINRGLYLERGVDGLDRPIPGRIEALRNSFRNFLNEVITILDEGG